MVTLPQTSATPLIRTDFSDFAAWKAACARIATPSEEDGFLAVVEILDDPAYDGLTSEQLLAMAPESLNQAILIVADKIALSSTEVPLLVIALNRDRGREIRVIASELWGVENNLSLANMDFHEFADSVDEDGVFRGFPPPPG
jgi:Domain of unknown function (DUF6924)